MTETALDGAMVWEAPIEDWIVIDKMYPGKCYPKVVVC